MVSSTDGSPTKTCWNRRSSAGSFSIRSRYSSSVVAPIMCSSPRASIGLSMLPASIAESPPAPAPTTVWSSSMNVMTCPPASLISSSTALSRSSNSPRYFAPATIAARSSAEHPPALEGVGDVAGHDPLGEPLDDGGLADAGLADQHRVVLGTPRQHLHDAADLGVAADDRVEPALLGGLGEVDGVLLERLVRRLRVLAGHAAVAADRGQSLAQPVGGQPGVGRAPSGPATPRWRARSAGARWRRSRPSSTRPGRARRPAPGSAPADAAGCCTVAPLARGSASAHLLGPGGERRRRRRRPCRPACARYPPPAAAARASRWIGSVLGVARGRRGQLRGLDRPRGCGW